MKSSIIFAFLTLLFVAGCVPSPDAETTKITPVPNQYNGNISTIYGNGGKIKDSLGFKIAPNIIWKDSSGVTKSINGLKGNVIIVNFWATWCTYCIAEIPDILTIENEFKDMGVTILGVSIDQTGNPLQDVTNYAKSKKMTYQIILDQYAKSYIDYGQTSGLPITFVIDQNGNIYRTIVGQTNTTELRRILNELL